MAERVVTEPLAGGEVIRAITQKIEQSLRKDCFLSDNNAYQTIRAKVHIELWCHDVGRVAEVKQVVESNIGQVPEGENEDEFLDRFEADFTIDEQEPNRLRVDTEQPVPVLTHKDGKPEVKRVKYQRKGAK